MKIYGFADEASSQLDGQIQALLRNGLDGLEVRGVNGANISDISLEDAAKAREQLVKAGLSVWSVGSPIGKIKIEEDFAPHFEVFKHVVNIAKTLGTKYIRMFSFYHEGGDEWTAEEREEVLARLRQMIAYAKEQGVILLHENEKGIYGDTADRCIDVMKELGCEHFRAVFDPANFVQCGQDTKYAFDNLKEYVEYMHIKDARFEDGKVVPAGMGDGNVAYVLKGLFENGYQGFLSLEPHLGSFEGLAALELDDKMEGLPKGGEGTFTLAYRALCDVLEGL